MWGTRGALRRIRHLPGQEGGAKLVGVISIGDVLKSRISEMELEANVLRDMAMATGEGTAVKRRDLTSREPA